MCDQAGTTLALVASFVSGLTLCRVGRSCRILRFVTEPIRLAEGREWVEDIRVQHELDLAQQEEERYLDNLPYDEDGFQYGYYVPEGFEDSD